MQQSIQSAATCIFISSKESISKAASVLFIWMALSISACSEQQKVIFEAQSIEYQNRYSYATSNIQVECSALSDDLATYMDSGWKVVASAPKEKVVADNKGTCVGTEYVLEKRQGPQQTFLVIGGFLLIAGIVLYGLRNKVQTVAREGFFGRADTPSTASSNAPYTSSSGGEATVSADGGSTVSESKKSSVSVDNEFLRSRMTTPPLLRMWVVLIAVVCLALLVKVLSLRDELANLWYPEREGYVDFVNSVIRAERALGVIFAVLCISVVALFIVYRKRKKDSEYV